MSVDAPARRAATRIEVELMSQSAVLRTALRRAINATEGALALASRLASSEPGEASGGTSRAVVVDADMPGLTGASLLEQMARMHAGLPLVIVVSDTARGRTVRDQLLGAGASCVFLRPVSDHPSDLKSIAREIVSVLIEGRARPAPQHAGSAGRPERESVPATPPGGARRGPVVRPKALVIGSSTGGPQALINLFQAFRPERVSVPVLIVQHMPAAFTPILAEHLTRATGWRATEATQGEALAGGEIRIAPGGRHMIVDGPRSGLTLGLTEDPPVNFCRPSADVLFLSAAACFGSAILCVVLTGMGHDGAEGVKAIKAAGGMIIAQDEATSVVWGMPGAAVATGAVDRVLPLPDIAPTLQGIVGAIA